MQDVKDWLVSDMDFKVGCTLFEKYCRNRIFVKSITQSPRNASKLEYELKKLLGIPFAMLFNQKCSNKELLKAAEKKEVNKPIKIKKATKEAQSQPKTDAELIIESKEYLKDLYVQIDIMHQELYNVDANNAPTNVKKRFAILEKRKPIIKKADTIYQLKEFYFKTGAIDDKLKKLLSTNPKCKKLKNAKTIINENC